MAPLISAALFQWTIKHVVAGLNKNANRMNIYSFCKINKTLKSIGGSLCLNHKLDAAHRLTN